MINLYDGQITDLLQNSLKYNPETQAIAHAVLQEKRRIMDLVERTRLMSDVDSLEERILDYLAVELRTPAYEDSLPLDTKRTLIKGTLPFYAKLGTPAAVDWVISSIFKSGGIQEWFDYGGEPHHFRVTINVTGMTLISLEEIEGMRRMIYAVKRLTSWLDEMRFTLEASKPAVLHVGGAGGILSTAGIPENTAPPKAPSTLRVGGTGGIRASRPIPESTAPPPSTTILRTGGVCTILSNLSGRD